MPSIICNESGAVLLQLREPRRPDSDGLAESIAAPPREMLGKTSLPGLFEVNMYNFLTCAFSTQVSGIIRDASLNGPFL